MPQCKALDNQVHVTIDGYYKPCCAFGEHSTAFPLTKYSAAEFMQSDYMQQIRNKMQSGWHPGCSACKKNEENKSQSVRQMYNFLCRHYTDIELLDLNLNNDCNLSCRMCSSLNSSKWAELLDETQKNNNSFPSIIKDLKKLKHIKYQGGEPFITKEISEVLNYIADNNCEFSFSTNCTVFPKKHLQLLSQARFLYVTFSIDGVGNINDYIRHGKEWSIVKDVFFNWIAWIENNQIKSFKNINTVVQAYNFHDLENIKYFANQHRVNWNGLEIQDIPELTINALPEDYIKKVLDSTNEKYTLDYKFDYNLYKKLKQRTKQHDVILGKKLEDYNKELYNVFCKIE